MKDSIEELVQGSWEPTVAKCYVLRGSLHPFGSFISYIFTSTFIVFPRGHQLFLLVSRRGTEGTQRLDYAPPPFGPSLPPHGGGGGGGLVRPRPLVPASPIHSFYRQMLEKVKAR